MEPRVQLPGAQRPGTGAGGVLLAHHPALLLHTALPQRGHLRTGRVTREGEGGREREREGKREGERLARISIVTLKLWLESAFS